MKIAMAVLVAGRHRRDVPAPGPPDRRARAGRLARCSASATWPCSASRSIGLVVLPTIARSSPGYVNDVLAVATSGSRPATSACSGPLNSVAGVGYIAGGLLFGIALFRAGVLARWAAALLAVGAVATIAILLLPEVNQRLFAIPIGIALIGLGCSLWREQRTPAARARAQLRRRTARPGRRPMTVLTSTQPHPVGSADRVGAVRAGRPRRWSPPSPGRCGWSSWPAARS